MPGQASLLPTTALNGPHKRQQRERTGSTSPNQSTAREQPCRPKHRKDRAAQARPPAPCQSAAAGSIAWSDTASFGPDAASWSFQSQTQPTEAQYPAARQQQQAGQGTAVLKINVDLGLVSFQWLCIKPIMTMLVASAWPIVMQAGLCLLYEQCHFPDNEARS